MFVGFFFFNLKSSKMIYAKLVNNWEKYILHSGTIIMACSGQKYGILGRAIMLTEVPCRVRVPALY